MEETPPPPGGREQLAQRMAGEHFQVHPAGSAGVMSHPSPRAGWAVGERAKSLCQDQHTGHPEGSEPRDTPGLSTSPLWRASGPVAWKSGWTAGCMALEPAVPLRPCCRVAHGLQGKRQTAPSCSSLSPSLSVPLPLGHLPVQSAHQVDRFSLVASST